MSARVAIPMIWVLAAAVLLRLLSAWESLPDRVAVHFGVAMQPNGWSSKRMLLAMITVGVVGHAALASWLLLHIGSLGSVFPLIQVVISAVMVCVFWKVINYNTRTVRNEPYVTSPSEIARGEIRRAGKNENY